MFDIVAKYLTYCCLSMLLITQGCLTNTSKPKKVIVVHARGLSFSNLTSYLDISDKNGFLKEAKVKGQLQKLEPITNAVTISNIASFETGTLPREHGIVGHGFADYQGQKLVVRNGFGVRFEKETFWEKADKDGLSILNIGALTLHGKHEQHQNIDCLAQGESVKDGQFIRVVPVESHQDSSVAYAEAKNKNRKIVFLENSNEAYTISRKKSDKHLLTIESTTGKQNKLQEGEWLELITVKKENRAEVFRLKWLETKGDTISLYVRGSFVNRGYPEEFLQGVEDNIGGSKGWPDIFGYAVGSVSRRTLIEEINTELDYVMNVFDFSSSLKSYDLIMIDYPLMDRYGHAFWQLITSSNQLDDELKEAYERADRDFAQIQKYSETNGYKLIISSGHGFSPIGSAVNLEGLLYQNGFIVDTGQKKWEAKAIPGKVSSHVYVNPNLSSKKRESIKIRLTDLFKKITHQSTGETVVDRVYTNSDLGEIGLDHSHAGDLFVMLNPGYVFARNADKKDSIFSEPIFKGDHGYGLNHEDSYGIIITNPACNSCKTIDISPMVLSYLGLK